MPKIPEEAWRQWPVLCLFSLVVMVLAFFFGKALLRGIAFIKEERESSRQEQEASRQERERERDRSEKIWDKQITAVDRVSECLQQHDKQSAERHSATIQAVLENRGRNGTSKD